MLTTTLRRIKNHRPCEPRWKKLLLYLGKTKADDEPLPFATILDSNGLFDALWCCQTAPEYHRVWRWFAVWCARQVQHLMKDQRSLDALDVAERYCKGLATDAELAAAVAAARGAARAAEWVAGAAARAAARAAALAAGDASRGAARAAALAAGDASRGAAWVAQESEFRRLVNGEGQN